MAVIRTSANILVKQIFHHSPLSSISLSSWGRAFLPCSCKTPIRGISFSRIRCAASDADGDRKYSSRLAQVQQLLHEAEERASAAGNEPIPQITLDHEKNRINKDGEIVISSTKTRTQKGNIDDALDKLQVIIDAAAYVPPPQSEEQKKKIAKMAAIGEQKRLKSKKVLSDKKAFRRSQDSWE